MDAPETQPPGPTAEGACGACAQKPFEHPGNQMQNQETIWMPRKACGGLGSHVEAWEATEKPSGPFGGPGDLDASEASWTSRKPFGSPGQQLEAQEAMSTPRL